MKVGNEQNKRADHISPIRNRFRDFELFGGNFTKIHKVNNFHMTEIPPLYHIPPPHKKIKICCGACELKLISKYSYKNKNLPS